MSEIIILGAGVAGLSAAVHLAEAGYAVTVLEAKDCVGGRIRSVETAGIVVETGAEFIHGVPPDTFAWLREENLEHYELDGEDLVYDLDNRGHLDLQQEGDAEDESPLDLLEKMTEWSEMHAHRDMTFAEYLAQEGTSPEDAAGAIGYVEGFNAADHRVISIRSLAIQQRAEDATEGDRLFHVRGGYSRLAEAMAAKLMRIGGKIELGVVVDRIAWSHGTVKLHADNGKEFAGQAALVTLPLGVLQKKSVTFDPEPVEFLRETERMRMGHVCRVSMVFRTRFWAEMNHAQHHKLQKLSFLFPEKRRVPEGPAFEAFWTPYPSVDPIMTAWTGGPAAIAFAGLNPSQIAEIAVRDLALALGVPVEAVRQELLGYGTHDWTSDPFAHGAYSYVAAGGADASERMTQPLEGTLFFAGEHTDITGHWGTVHGAIRSGIRAAKQLIEIHPAVR
ncbi:flavin monoamine oxidase family protein [Terriglobus saanensis]|uniref:Tryptophan 2-monooxygenase n=1 Tax=Terriglobus saanensis (strain ATCC BAA-1853 / DSM 23119 / SP1PR4) TaxID=401053 RepID=E8UXG6_TERSS|nr:NAD(P)/FAD-dependent oxidoreductase [Terriglobus saanensis]ADV84190.1 amine oxidase [Terriglobus saanensis SP1PR4]